MKNNKLGCFTGVGIVATLITLLSIVGIAFASGSLMFTAGDLNAQTGNLLGGVSSHAQITKCSACHVAAWETDTMADRCATCHTDIAAQMFDVAKLHGIVKQKSGSLACRDCHPEHRGATASLTDLNGNLFPHETLGFSLKHHQRKAGNEPFSCRDCHGEDVTTFVSDSCQNCHSEMDSVFTEAHALSLGTDCLGCHNGDSKFDHNIAAFKLEGAHIKTACKDCHQNNVYKGTPSDCYSCHKNNDEHNGKFGTDCSACHNPSNWDAATFDHDRSNFPLTGAHVKVECENCHKNGQFKGLDTTCLACHAEPAEHAGQFGTDCAVCHSTKAWEPAEFNGKHTFPLNHGESGSVSCVTCHPDSLTTYTCYGCHEHTEARISSKHREEGIPNFQDCVECHADGREHDN
jgi:hypothetical protein